MIKLPLGMGFMSEKVPKSGDSPSKLASEPESGRRQFLKNSLGAAPIVLTIGNRSGWGGGSTHGTLWSSAGTNWRHRGGRWWRKGDWKDWDGPKPPHWSDHDDRPKHEAQDGKDSRQRDWDWDDDHKDRGAGGDWKWYRERERRRLESGQADEKRVNPLVPSDPSER